MHIEVELDCGACRLRPLRGNDAPAMARHADNPKVAMYLRDRFPHPYSTEDAVRFIEYATETQEECVACIDVAGEAAGAIGLQFRKDIERCSAELGYWVGEPFWGRGAMTAAIRCFTTWAMPRFALTRVYAEVFADNPASGRVLEKCGFQKVGVLRKAAIKRGVHHDYVLYDLVR
ncbi:MAG: GNAT family N-acetyltransferase [Terriglobales bacterium]